MQPGFPFEVGSLYYGGKINGRGPVVWTQAVPGGPVSPAPPTLYPGVYQGYNQTPFAYQGFLLLGCQHWVNGVEVFEVWDPYNEMRAALCCCPVCSFIQLIVEPASDWFNTFYSIYNTGLVEHLVAV